MKNYFAKNLKYLREKKGLEQQELADLLNVGRSTISCWENELRSPQMEYVLKLADFFNVDNDFIFKDLSSIDINDPKKQFTEEEKKEALKQVLKEKGFLNDNEEMSSEDFNRLIDFAKRNKDFIVDKKDGW